MGKIFCKTLAFFGLYWRYLQNKASRLRKLEKRRKNYIVSVFAILVLAIGVFFNLFSNPWVYAKTMVKTNKPNIGTVDPLSRIGKGVTWRMDAKAKVCADNKEKKKDSPSFPGNEKFLKLVAGHPIEEMIPFISKRDKEVAYYLVAIAKKESDWGKHTPKKEGKECYNFWGYRGKENMTKSGYSCFDSPEHAVTIVGNRIENLLSKKIDTPAKMVVWKCGRDCEAAGGQAAANKWISDVAHVYHKLQS